jgi:LysM repeat protein
VDFDRCPLVETEAAAFVLGDVDAETRAGLVNHLDACASCRHEVSTLAAAVDSISALAPAMTPSPGFVDRVLTAAGPALAPVEVDLMPPAWVSTPPGRTRPVPVVARRRRTLTSLIAGAALLGVLGMAYHTAVLVSLALATAVLAAAYLALVTWITHSKARHEIVAAFEAHEVADDSYWRELRPELLTVSPADEQLAAPVVEVRNTALVHFVLSYFLGWALTPLVGLIRLIRGDLTGLEQSPLLGHIVDLQRMGRQRSLRLLVAGATTVAVAGGGAGAVMLVAPSVASAATATASQTYTVRAGDTLGAIAERYGVAVSSLAQLNGITNPNLILPGEVIRLSGPASSASGGTGNYTVQPGDTLGAIASRFGMTVAALAGLNDISDPNLILVGQTLRVPSNGGPTLVSATKPTTYTVRAGDTLDAIANRFGTTVASLAAANHIGNPNLIEVGQVLTLQPTGAGSAPAPSPASSKAPTPAPSAPVTAGYVNPFAGGNWSPSRIDEGVDWIPNSTSPVVAIGQGVITYSSMDSGWQGGAFISYRLTSGSHAGYYVYVAENLSNLLPAGTVVSAGQQIATAPPGYPWTEWGWASASGPEPAPSAQYNGAPDGTATPGGQAFARFLMSLGVTGIADPGPGSTTP